MDPGINWIALWASAGNEASAAGSEDALPNG
jgi:hypothetical protein